MATAIGRGELPADLVGFRVAEVGVQRESFLPVVASLAGVSGGLIGVGETVMGTRLLVFLADLGGQA
jgi:hypothetical protein